MIKEIVITEARRTPLGSFQGELTAFKATQLGSIAIQALGVKDCVEEVIMGCVLPAGLGQAPARQAAIAAGISDIIPTTTVNKVCGSGMKTIMMASDQILTGQAECIVAGGMESMSNAPYLLDRARTGYRIGHGQILDHMFKDGLEDAYHKNADGSARLMGTFAEDTAEKYDLSRDQQEKYTLETLEKVQKAIAEGCFTDEICAIEVKNHKGEAHVIQSDEPPSKVKAEKFAALKPAFKPNGTITAATSSSIADGAAAVCVMSGEKAEQLGMKPLARIVGYASNAHQPEWFTTAPVGAIQKACRMAGWDLKDVDLFEINEAFAVVPMAAMKELSIPREKVNIHGGACVLGHPLGASGARIVVTLVHALRRYGLKRGIAALCIGGGEGTAIAIESL